MTFTRISFSPMKEQWRFEAEYHCKQPYFYLQEPSAKKVCHSTVMTALSSFSPAPVKKFGSSLQVDDLES